MLDFPNSPTNGQTFTNASGGAWVFDGVKWNAAINVGFVVIADTPPTAYPGSLWWDSVSGQLYLRYNDPNSTEWVVANSGAMGMYLPLTAGPTVPLTGRLVINLNAAAVASLPTPPTGTGIRIIGTDTVSPILDIEAYGTGAYAEILGSAARGTGAAPTAVQAGDIISQWQIQSYDGTAWGYGGAMGFAAVDTWTTSDHNTEFRVSTIAAATGNVRISVRGGLMVLTSAGALPPGGDLGPGTLNAAAGGQFGGPVTINSGPAVGLSIQTASVVNGFVGLALINGSPGGRTYFVTSTDTAAGAGGGKFGVWDNTAGSYRLLIDSSGNAAFSGNVVASGQYSSTGTVAGYSFDDRGTPGSNWVWYSTGVIARLWHGGGDVHTVDTNGNLTCNNVLFGPGAAVPSPIQASHVISRNGATLVLTSDGGDNTSVCSNLYLGPGPTWRYLTAGSAMMFQVLSSAVAWFYAPSGVAGASAPLTNIAQFDSGGNLIAGAILQANTPNTSTQAILILNIGGFRQWRTIVNPGDGGYFVQDYSAGQLNRIHVDTSGNCTSSSSWGAISDAAVKTDIVDHPRGLADVLKLQPRKYTYNGEHGFEGDGYGLVAQELAEVMPELVRDFPVTQETTLKAVVETGLIWPMINAIKELTARVAALEAR